MSIQINTVKEVILDGQPTGLSVSQREEGTVVYRAKTGERVTMPHQRYTLSAPAGIDKFETDIKSVI